MSQLSWLAQHSCPSSSPQIPDEQTLPGGMLPQHHSSQHLFRYYGWYALHRFLQLPVYLWDRMACQAGLT